MFGLSPCHKGRKKIINELKDKKKKKGFCNLLMVELTRVESDNES